MTICLIHISAAGYAQRISLDKKNASLQTVFKEIRKQSGYDFVYSTPQLNISKPVTIKITNASLKEALDLCFLDQPLSYSIEEKTIVVKRKPIKTASTIAAIPSMIISGSVTDTDGKALPGASVMILNEKRATLTNQDGYFRIPIPIGATIRFSMIGFKSVDTLAGEKTELRIKLKEQNMDLGELVVVGYGQVKKENMTTSVSSITASQITQMPTSNLSQVFAGRIPGILARTNSGTPGGEKAQLLVRTGDGSQSPLIVIDGVPRLDNNQFSLQQMDPNEVESISVLKDNAAGAVYGARAANGVIIITTKRGKIGKPQFSYTGNFNWSRPSKMVKNLDGYGFAIASNEYYLNSGLAAPYSEAVLDTIKNQLAPYKYGNTDWIGLLSGKPVPVISHNLNVNGGSEAIRYFITGSYTDQGGMYAGNSYKRYTLQNNLDIKLSNQFKAQVNFGYRGGNQNMRAPSVLNTAANASPLVPAYMPDGSFGTGPSGGANPLALISDQSGYQYIKDNYLTTNNRLTWEPNVIKGLSVYSNFYVEKSFTRGKTYTIPVPLYKLDPNSPTGLTQTGGAGKPSLTDNMRDANSYTIDLAMEYKKQVGQHSLQALALYSVSEISNNINTDTRLNLVAPGLDIINLGSTVGEATTGTRTQAARTGYVGRLTYDFDKRLFLEGSFRMDGSTAFAPGHRWGFFPGGSAGWIISKENFFQPLTKVINSLKLRASIGLTGDDGINGNTYYYTYRVVNTGLTNSGAGYMFGNTYSPTFLLSNSTLPNENITWAKNRQENIGIDAVLWNRRLGLTFDIYQKNRYDILATRDVNLPSTFGINGPIQNFAKLRDRGFELELSSENRIGTDWTLGLNANITYVQTVKIDYGTKDLPDYQRTEGRSTNTLVGYHALGIFQTAEEISNWPLDQDGLKNSTIKPGDIKFADLNGDGKLTADDQQWFNNYGFPPINLGFGFNLKYKGLTLTAFFNAALGGYIKYGTPLSWQFTYDNAWRPGNEGAKYPRLASSTNNSRTSDATMIKDDFLRLRDLRLGYELPKKWTDAMKLKQVRLYAQASNLFTWTSVLGGIDPETPNLGTGGTTGGFYPNQKNIGFGVNVNF